MNGNVKVITAWVTTGLPIQLTEQAAEILFSELSEALGKYQHEPGGCEHGTDCPCRIRAAQEVRGTTA